jgi:16S rRNA processing protein RimM
LNDPHEQKRGWVLVARILRPRGNKGEVVAELLTDFPSRFSTLKQIYLRKNNGEPRSAGLQHFWIDRNHPGMGVFHFAGCATISDAESLRGHDVLLPLEARVTLPAGQYFVTDLIGCTVFELPMARAKLSSPACAMEEAPRVLGTVRDVFFTGESVAGTPILQVETPGGELLVPLAEDICMHIDVAGRRIEVKLPEGLSDVNAPGS